MGKPKIIGYANEYTGPLGGTIGAASKKDMAFVRRRAMYAERQFHASLVLDLYHVYCKNCMTTTITNPEHLPHDTAARHRCLYNPEESK